MINNFSISKVEITSINIFVIGLFLCLNPFYIWHTDLDRVGTILCFVSSLHLLRKSYSLKIGILLIGFFTFYSFSSLYVYRSNIIGYIFTFLPIILFVIDEKFWIEIYKRFCLIFSVTILPSLILHILVTIGGVSLNSYILTPDNINKQYFYNAYPLFVISGVENLFPRFCGYYDEPGVVGTVCGICLIINKFNLRKLLNWPILLAGIISFSFYFYLLLIIYLFLFYHNRKIKVIIFVSFSLIFNILSTSDIFNEYIFSRLQIIDGKLSGDNRVTESFQLYYDNFIKTNDLFFGKGRGFSVATLDSKGASYKYLIIDYGLIAVFLFCSLYSFLSSYIIKKKSTWFISLFLFFTLLFQRPFIFNYFYVSLFLFAIYALNYNYDERRNESTVG